ncbi:hypothetical protein H6F86_08550 [Phormidium sp. FACHB-592]|nr:hypothetical protein [Phormidium sp. FACHB-592]
MGLTSLRICHNRCIAQYKVFDNLAARYKTSVDCFFGSSCIWRLMTEEGSAV